MMTLSGPLGRWAHRHHCLTLLALVTWTLRAGPPGAGPMKMGNVVPSLATELGGQEP